MTYSSSTLGVVRRTLFRLFVVLLTVGLGLLVVPATHAQTSTRLAAFENTRLTGEQTPFVIEEMQVGHIRHLIDYLLLHGRFNAEAGESELAGAQFQWAASLMDLNVGLADTPEQNKVRAAANEIDELAQSVKAGTASSDVHARLFRAHHALATYHQTRAMKLLGAVEPASRRNVALVRQNAIFQKKAGLALSAALTHYDRATALAADLKKVTVPMEHKKDVNNMYTFVWALKVAKGQVDTERAKSSAEDLGQFIAALRVG
jgi:hypothetical protein